MRKAIWMFAATMMLFGAVSAGQVAAQMGAKDEPKKDEPKKDEVKKLDLPWTVEDCKKGMKKGQTVKYKSVTKAAGNETVAYMVQEILEVSDKGYKAKTTNLNAEGKPEGDATEEEKTWDAMFEGLEFTTADTKVTEEKVKVAGGEFECKVYTQTKEEEGSKSTNTFYFIKNKPGHIAKVTVKADYGGMEISYEMELVESKG